MGGTSALAQGQTARRDSLNVEMFLSGAVSSGLPSEFRPFVSGDAPQVGHRSTLFSPSVDYVRHRRRLQLFARASTFFRYASDVDEVAVVNRNAEVGAAIRVSSRSKLTVTQKASYSPPYLYELFPTAAPLPLGEAIPLSSAYRTESTQYRTSIVFAAGSPRTTQVTTTADYETTAFDRRIASFGNLTTYRVGGKVSHALSRRGGVAVGYQYQTGDFALNESTKEHRATISVDYSPPLSATRRATFRLDLSPSVIESPSEAGSVSRYSHLQGEATVSYPFRPKWRTEASYRRDVQYVAGLNEPVLSSGSRIQVNGSVGRRVGVTAFVGRAHGTSAIATSREDLSTSTGDVRITYSLTHSLTFLAEYLYSTFDLGERARIRPDFPTMYEQHEVRFGLTYLFRALGR